MSPYINRISIQRANARLMAGEGVARATDGISDCTLDKARRLLRQHASMSVEAAGRLAMQQLTGVAR